MKGKLLIFRYTLLLFSLTAASILFASCSSEEKSLKQNNVDEKQTATNNNIALSKKDFNIISNKKGDFKVFVQKETPDNARWLHLFSAPADSIIFSDKIIDAEIKWVSEYEFSVTEYPGIISEDNDHIKPKYIFNVLERRKK